MKKIMAHFQIRSKNLGFSLVELMVVVAISMMAMVGTTQILTQNSRLNAATQAKNNWMLMQSLIPNSLNGLGNATNCLRALNGLSINTGAIAQDTTVVTSPNPITTLSTGVGPALITTGVQANGILVNNIDLRAYAPVPAPTSTARPSMLTAYVYADASRQADITAGRSQSTLFMGTSSGTSAPKILVKINYNATTGALTACSASSSGSSSASNLSDCGSTTCSWSNTGETCLGPPASRSGPIGAYVCMQSWAGAGTYKWMLANGDDPDCAAFGGVKFDPAILGYRGNPMCRIPLGPIIVTSAGYAPMFEYDPMSGPGYSAVNISGPGPMGLAFPGSGSSCPSGFSATTWATYNTPYEEEHIQCGQDCSNGCACPQRTIWSQTADPGSTSCKVTAQIKDTSPCTEAGSTTIVTYPSIQSEMGCYPPPY